MSEAATTAGAGARPPGLGHPSGLGWVMDRVRETEIDLRLFGMVIALAAILIGVELGRRQGLPAARSTCSTSPSRRPPWRSSPAAWSW